MPLQGNIVSETLNAKHFTRIKIAIYTAIGLIQMYNIYGGAGTSYVYVDY